MSELSNGEKQGLRLQYGYFTHEQVQITMKRLKLGVTEDFYRMLGDRSVADELKVFKHVNKYPEKRECPVTQKNK
jgi:hypothetical protein